MAGRVGKCPYCQASVSVLAASADPRLTPTPPPPPKPPQDWVDEPPRGSLLKTAAVLLGALALGGLLCAVFIVGIMLGRSRGGGEPTLGAATEIAQADDSSPAPTDSPAEAEGSAAASAEKNLASQVHDILRRNCYACHGEGGTAEGGFNFVLRRDKLIENEHVVAGNPDESRLLERIKDGEMPPEGEGSRPTEEEIALIQQWIEAGAPDFSAPIERSFVTNEEIFRLLRGDVEAANGRDRRFLRYFSLVHLHNAGISDDELTTYRLALAKLINSLSKNREIVALAPVDPQGNLLRLDLRDVKWTSDIWKKLTDATPYGIVFDFADARQVYEATGSQTPLLRGDWVVAAASRPPLYHEVLQIPATFPALLKDLNVEVQRNIAEDRVVRAGFNNSGVSQNNRLIERHDFRDGALWVSYDFAENVGRRNLFQHPLGPGTEERHFLHDGGEIIFNLPNGLQAYMLVDGQGNRIDKGPTNIVSDKRRPDRQVQNGISCMSCHYGGIILKNDEVRAHVLANRAGFQADHEDILALYKPNEKIAELQKRDANRFLEALNKLGIERVTETNEPIVNMAIRFESNLDLKLAAAELGLRPEEFQSKLQAHPKLARVLGVVNAGGALKRDVFVKVFREAIETFGMGTPVGEVATPTPQPQDLASEKPQPADATNVKAPPPPSSTPPGPNEPNEGAATARTWTDRTGKFRVVAKFVGFNDREVQLRKEDGQIVSVGIQLLSESDQRFVLEQPPEATIDLPPGIGEVGQVASNRLDLRNPGPAPREPRGNQQSSADDAYDYGPGYGRRPPVLRAAPALKYPTAEPRIWTPSTHDPFVGIFHDLEAGVLRIRLSNGIVLSGPVSDMSQLDLDYIQAIVGEAEYTFQTAPPPPLFGN